MFWGKNTVLLNDNNCNLDKLWFARHTLDLSLGVKYHETCEDTRDPIAEFLLTLRDKAVWGNPGSVASTNETPIKVSDAVLGVHKHTIPRHIFWMREGWFSFDLGRAFHIHGLEDHTLTVGAFPFQLGRGIALGTAFAIGPELLGFYSDSLIDQFAFGAKFSGPLCGTSASYDFYASVWDNKSGSVRDIGEKVRAQEYGRLERPARGFGRVTFLIAGRLQWTVFDSPAWGRLEFEPYALYNRQPEQRVEFVADAQSKLGTIGAALEYKTDCFEWGIEGAVNVGRQLVRGWDRNAIVMEALNNTGVLELKNNHVKDRDPSTSGAQNIPFVRGSTAQTIIQNTFQDDSENGKKIGMAPLTDPLTGVVADQGLYNAADRFRNPYINRYRGWMFIMDGCYHMPEHGAKVCATFGIASGDQNPNDEVVDGTYDGFISLQEVYNGKRVKSAFLLGGAGKPLRPLSRRNQTRNPDRFSSSLSGFTNLVYTGASINWEPPQLPRELVLNPNILCYWEERPCHKFDVVTKQDLDERASAFLGVEVNLFSHYYIYNDVKFYFIGSLFFPGQHYTDIKGKPINKEQQLALDRLDKTGFDADRIPNIGDDRAYTVNVGLDFKF